MSSEKKISRKCENCGKAMRRKNAWFCSLKCAREDEKLYRAFRDRERERGAWAHDIW